jgi:hypothetical protein
VPSATRLFRPTRRCQISVVRPARIFSIRAVYSSGLRAVTSLHAHCAEIHLTMVWILLGEREIETVAPVRGEGVGFSALL